VINTRSKKLIKGFSLLEFLIVIGIIAVLALGGTVTYRGVFLERQLDGATQKTVAVLKNAQSRAISGENNSNWGVHFGGDPMIHLAYYYQLFYGPSYTSGTVVSTAYYPTSTIAATIGSQDVIFYKNSGQADFTFSIALQLWSDASSRKTITVHPNGLIESN